MPDAMMTAEESPQHLEIGDARDNNEEGLDEEADALLNTSPTAVDLNGLLPCNRRRLPYMMVGMFVVLLGMVLSLRQRHSGTNNSVFSGRDKDPTDQEAAAGVPTAAAPTWAPTTQEEEIEECSEIYLGRYYSSSTNGWMAWKNSQGHYRQEQWCRTRTAACSCTNPLLPRSRNDKAGWSETVQRNQELAKSAASEARPLDMVFVGDSLVEYWQGTKRGEASPDLEPQHRVYQQMFESSDSLIRGLALGVGGDRAPNVLYRLQHGGELPDALQPPLFWILVGTNDLTVTGCNVNATLAGILQITELLLRKRPTAKVVLHSVLPRGRKPLWSHSNIYWRHIYDINHGLECLALTHERMAFFNATNLFLEQHRDDDDDEEGPRINQTLFFSDDLHPSAVGAIPWGIEIVRKSLQLLGRNVPADEFEAWANRVHLK